jgi:hypothetical protein
MMYQIDITQLMFLHENQRAVLQWMLSQFGMAFVITSLYRVADPGVHGVIPLRGTDLRCHSIPVANEIKRETNAHWKYDPERPNKKVVRAHTGTAFHLHVQTHPRTYEV